MSLERICDSLAVKATLITFLTLSLFAGILYTVGEAKTTIELWTVQHLWYKRMEEAIEQFMLEYPDIEIDIVYVPGSWGELHEKLMLAAATDGLPTIAWSHTEKNIHLEDKDLLAPIPWDRLPYGVEDFMNYEQMYNYNGEYYRFPWGMLNGVLYYNRFLLDQSGVSEYDLPTSFEEMTRLARKLTQMDASGDVTQYGFANGPIWQWFDVFYQHGEYLFKEDGTPNLASPAGINSMEVLFDLLEAGGRRQGVQNAGFRDGNVVMQYEWAWMAAQIREHRPDLDFGIAVPPTISGSLTPAFGRMNCEEGFCVFKQASPEEQEAAWKLLAYLLDDDDFLLDLSKTGIGLTPKYELWSDPVVKDDPALWVQAQTLPYSVYQADVQFVVDILGGLMGQAERGEISPQQALMTADVELAAELARSKRRINERNYVFED